MTFPLHPPKLTGARADATPCKSLLTCHTNKMFCRSNNLAMDSTLQG